MGDDKKMKPVLSPIDFAARDAEEAARLAEKDEELAEDEDEETEAEVEVLDEETSKTLRKGPVSWEDTPASGIMWHGHYESFENDGSGTVRGTDSGTERDYKGRPTVRDILGHLRDEGKSIRQMAELTGIPKSTVDRLLKEKD